VIVINSNNTTTECFEHVSLCHCNTSKEILEKQAQISYCKSTAIKQSIYFKCFKLQVFLELFLKTIYNF